MIHEILKRMFLQPMAINFTSTRQHAMDQLAFRGAGFDRGIRQALQIAVPCLAHAGDGEELPTPTDVPVPEPFDVPVPEPFDVPVPEPFDVPVPTPTDIPPPQPRDVPPPKSPNPAIDPAPKPRAIP